MAIKQQLWSLNALACELGCDIRKVGRALNNVPADGKLRGHDAWFLKTALNALTRYETRTGNAAVRSAVVDWGVLEEEGTRLAAALENGIAEIAAEPDIDKRREMMRRVAPFCGELDRLLERGEAATGAKESELWMMQQVRGQLVGGALREIMELCHVRLADEDASPT